MKLILGFGTLLLLVNYAFSQIRPYTSYNSLNNVPILKQNYDLRPDGSYNYEYETGNGISAHENGQQKGVDLQVAQGSFSYTGPDGYRYTINYIADEGGFRASGAHIPTPPPIPPEIVKALAYNAAHPEEDRYYSKRK